MGSVGGIPTANPADKIWLIFQALGDVAFSYPFSIILLEIQVYIYIYILIFHTDQIKCI